MENDIDDFFSNEPSVTSPKEASATYGNNKQQYGKSNYNKGGFSKFPRKEEVVEERYVPVAVYVDRDFPSDAKDTIYKLATKLLNKGNVIRINGDDQEFVNRLTRISSEKVEIYIPWKPFNGFESKHYYNTLTAKHLAQKHFAGWDKVPDAVKSLMARNIRMIFGDKNNSPMAYLLTWSPDGAVKAGEVNKETGRASFIIKTAATYGFRIANITNRVSETAMFNTFDIEAF